MFERYQEFFEIAVPAIASLDLSLHLPVMIVARVTAPTARGQPRPAGPRDRAKAIMDALHDQRRKPPYFHEAGSAAPLVDDKPDFVRGLAVEVHSGLDARTEYRLGSDLVIEGSNIATFDVDLMAPNDIWTTPSNRERIERSREAFAAAVVTGWPDVNADELARAQALVIRHRPDRDEDNTWSHWLGALTGRPAWSRKYWKSDEPPLARWRPMAIASVSEPGLPCATRFEVFA